MRRPRARVRVALFAIALVAGCGLRTAVRPPEETAPVIPGAVTATHEHDAVVVRWKRADKTAGGEKLTDLAAFVVERKGDAEDAWKRVGHVDVADQEKIRQRKDFSWRDTDPAGPASSYRVIAVDADRQEGPPTAPVHTIEKPPAPKASVAP